MQRKTAAARNGAGIICNYTEDSFDGDRDSWNAVFTDESVVEVKNILNSKAAYLNPQGGFRTSTDIQTVNLVLHNLTGHTPVFED